MVCLTLGPTIGDLLDLQRLQAGKLGGSTSKQLVMFCEKINLIRYAQ
jgi:hypothetical protein